MVCDRWLTDSLVDLELRYGRHRGAEWILALLAPRPDLAILLEIDAATAARRKPRDQAERVFAEMERRYGETARRRGLAIIDARAPRREVSAALERLIDQLLARSGAPGRNG